MVTIAILGLLAAIALPRFIELTESAHTGNTATTHGAVATSVNLVHAKWMAQLGGSTVALDGATVDVNAAGWPVQPAGAPMTQLGCLDLWNVLLSTPPSIATGFVPGRNGWGALAAGNLCGWIYEPDTTPIRLILYDTSVGSVTYLTL